MKIYLAHPISGLSYEEVIDYYGLTEDDLVNNGYTVLSPMTGKGHLSEVSDFQAEGYNHPTSTNHAIVERDQWMVNQSDVVYVNLIAAKRVSIGAMMELAWAHQLGKHTIVSMEEHNAHRHAFVLEAADIVFESHEQAMDYLYKLI